MSPFLELFKAAEGSLSLPMAEAWPWMIFNVPSKPFCDSMSGAQRGKLMMLFPAQAVGFGSGLLASQTQQGAAVAGRDRWCLFRGAIHICRAETAAGWALPCS